MNGPKIWTAGTLRYTFGGLVMLFFWLLCNDLCLMLMEQVAPQLTPLLLKDKGASNREIAFYISALTGVFTVWINPFVSTWSDRTRTSLGRRRPFLLAAAPLCALCLAVIPFAPRIAAALGFGSVSAVVMLTGLCYLVYSIFNSVLTALFMYYFWDVVPEEMLGRFTALTKVVITVVGFFWNYYIFGLAERHMTAIYVVIAAFFLVVYMISLGMVREGEYPPPPQRPKQSVAGVIRSYFVECFSDPYYLWIYAAMACYQLGGGGFSNVYQIFYFRDALGFSLDTIGQLRSWPSLAVVLLAFPVGILVDRIKPGRVIIISLVIWTLVDIHAFFFLKTQGTLLFFLGMTTFLSFVYSTAYGVLNVEVFPREKLGQFCSAVAMTYNLVSYVLAVPLGMLFDYLKDYRYVFAWCTVFQAISALLYLKVYRNWKRDGGRARLAGSPEPAVNR